MTARFKYYWLFNETAYAFYAVEIEPGQWSDLSGETMLARGIPLPVTPSFNTWKQEVYSGRRCGSCWAKLPRGLAAVAAHHEERHLPRRKEA